LRYNLPCEDEECRVELRFLLSQFIRRWWLIAIPVIAAAALALPDMLAPGAQTGGFSASIRYSAFQDISAIPRSEGDYQDLWLSSELLVNALTDWVRSSSFREEIAARLQAEGVAFSAGALGTAADNERSVGQISFGYPDGPTLDAVVDAAIAVLQTRAADYFPQLGGQNASVTVLDRTAAAPAPPSLPNRFAPVLRIAVGLLAGLGLAALSLYLDPFVRRREDVASAGVPVIAALPKV
jgi:capsular polysaccharide biosynthesis protein